jgi:hypothetical protein
MHAIDGDFNFDDQINAYDYFLIDSAFIGQTNPPPHPHNPRDRSHAGRSDATGAFHRWPAKGCPRARRHVALH